MHRWQSTLGLAMRARKGVMGDALLRRTLSCVPLFIAVSAALVFAAMLVPVHIIAVISSVRLTV